MKFTVSEKELGEIALQHGYPNAKLIRELIAIGYRRGFTRALRKGLHRIILRQIARRFGAVPATIRQQIEMIDKIKQLEHIAGGLLEVKDLKQLRKLVAPNGKFA